MARQSENGINVGGCLCVWHQRENQYGSVCGAVGVISEKKKKKNMRVKRRRSCLNREKAAKNKAAPSYHGGMKGSSGNNDGANI